MTGCATNDHREQINLKKLGMVPTAATANHASTAGTASTATNSDALGGQAPSAFDAANNFVRSGVARTAFYTAEVPGVDFIAPAQGQFFGDVVAAIHPPWTSTPRVAMALVNKSRRNSGIEAPSHLSGPPTPLLGSAQ